MSVSFVSSLSGHVFVFAYVCVFFLSLSEYRPPRARKYVSWHCWGLSKTSTTVCAACLGVDLQLGRHNNYKCIWKPTALMLSIIAFSSKLHEKTWNHVFSFVLWDTLWQHWNSRNNLPGSSPGNRWLKCVCAYVYLRAGALFNCTWRGWYGCTVVRTAATQEFACFSQIPRTSSSGGAESLNVCD